MKFKFWLRPALFTLAGAAVGLACYFVGCAGGSCAIASSLVNTMVYMGFIGWLISVILGKRCHKCSM